jgi:hypothetical protein
MRSLRLLPLFFLTACPYVDTPPTEATSTALKLSDVAVLFPLPATQAADSLLRPTSEGSHGPLLPAYAQEAVDRFPAAPPGAPPGGPPALSEDDLRLVALNLDDCFPGDDGGCRALRVIFQPIATGPRGELTTIDFAAHVLYDLPQDELSALVREVSALDEGRGAYDPYAPLGVHPILESDPEYAADYQALLLRYVGADRLTKVTLMEVLPPGRCGASAVRTSRARSRRRSRSQGPGARPRRTSSRRSCVRPSSR